MLFKKLRDKKRIKEEIEKRAKFKLHDFVNFRYHDDLYFGYIYNIKLMDDIIYYDIQIGGQCPSVIYDIKEDIISLKNK